MMKGVETLSFFAATVAALALAAIVAATPIAPRPVTAALPVFKMETIVITAEAAKTPEQLALVD